jgi:hypothetical protein
MESHERVEVLLDEPFGLLRSIKDDNIHLKEATKPGRLVDLQLAHDYKYILVKSPSVNS